MKRPRIFTTIKRQYHAHNASRREVIARSNDALSKSKRAIFALHREDMKGAEALLKEASGLFAQSEKKFKKFPELKEQGAYRAALEEYAEALLFKAYLETGELPAKLDDRVMDPSIYLAGLSDMTGELVRYAVRQVTLGNTIVVEESYQAVSMIVEFFLDMDLTGYLRTKFDQSKKNLSRLENMTYDLAIRS
jgi:predicted translin family RNA/ssDNA-binding protein